MYKYRGEFNGTFAETPDMQGSPEMKHLCICFQSPLIKMC